MPAGGSGSKRRKEKTVPVAGHCNSSIQLDSAWTEAARSVWPQFYDKVGGKAVVDEALAIMQQ